MKNQHEILSERIKTIPLSSEHAKTIYDNREFVLVYNSSGTTREKFDGWTLDNQIEETKKLLKEIEDGKRFGFIIFDKNNNEFIGKCNLHTINKEEGSARISISIKEKFWNKGYGTEALSQLIKFAFEEIKLHRLEYGCYSFNKMSQKLAEKLGFKYEKTIKNVKKIDDEYFDRVEYIMINNS